MPANVLKVAVLAERLGTNAGGTEVYEKQLLASLAKNVQKREDIKIIPLVAYKNARDLLPEAFRNICTVLKPEGKSGVFMGTYSAIRKTGADLLHSCFVTPPVFSELPVVATVHDLGFFAYPEHYKPLMRFKLEKALERNLRRADHIVTVSGHTMKDLIEYTGISPAKVTTVYNGTGHEFTCHKNIETVPFAGLSRYGIRKPYILYAGRLEPRKNVPSLIAAYEILRKTGKFSGQLVMIGARQTFLCREAQERINRSFYKADIIQTGHVSDFEVESFYSGAELLAFISLYEGFGFPALEAMIKGVPVVCSNAACLPEIVGNAGVTVDPLNPFEIAEGFEKIIHHREFRDKMISLAKKRALEFSWDKTASQMIAVYKKVFDARLRLKKGLRF